MVNMEAGALLALSPSSAASAESQVHTLWL